MAVAKDATEVAARGVLGAESDNVVDDEEVDVCCKRLVLKPFCLLW
jgi:hypothetical protein